ncbi:MAG: sodium:solute symporter family protein [Terrimicrobiaceae bacterium]
MPLFDWILLLVPLGIVTGIAIYTKRYLKSVADFMSGGRMAGPYLLAVARGELQAGAVVFVAMFEVISKSGFTLAWWGWVSVPVGLLVATSGFVVYRYRETRAMTLSQFFELRYSKNFRVFTGMLGFVAGIVNFGIIPAVGARCMVYFLGVPSSLHFWGFSVPTYIPLMAFFLMVALFMTLSGGLISVMVTDCIEGIMAQVFYLVIIVALVMMFRWEQISEVLANRAPGHSMLNPFDSSGIKDFNIWYVLMSMFVGVYGTMAWQNAQGYNSAAISPHASVMGGILGRWRESGKGAVVTLLAVCAMTFLHHPDFAAQAAVAHQEVGQISTPQIQQQMEIPVALSHLLPVGVRGVLCAILLMGIFGGDSTHLHSWGGIFVQDVLVPLRKRPFSPEEHIKILRRSIVGVALFAFLFGIFFRQTEYITMWWIVTTAIYVGGAGSVIIGGLYWKNGTTAGAWVALLTGSSLSVGGILARQIWGDAFPFNVQEISFAATLLALFLYVLVSLLTCREKFDMDRMLHRGKHASPKDSDTPAPGRTLSWVRFLGVDEHFTRGDKWITGSLFGWSMLWFAIFVVGSIWNHLAPWPEAAWSTYWHVAGIGVPVFIAFVTAIWFTWGGLRDIRRLFEHLRSQKSNHLDDGTVVGHQNLDEQQRLSK